MKFFDLEGKYKIPALAFGSGSKHRIRKWEATKSGEETLDLDLIEVLKNAIDVGFTHLDTAEVYTTQGEMARAIVESGVKRENLWICDKADSGWPDANKKAISSGPRESCETGLKIFGFDYFDQYLLHSPFFRKDLIEISLEEAWKQMEELYFEGKCHVIGVCNFNIEELKRILKIAKVKPQVNQIEYHLYLQEQSPGIVEFCKSNDILVEAYSPLTPVLDSKIGSCDHPLKSVIKKLADKYNVQESSICLRWVYESGVLPVTTTSNRHRMEQAFEMFTFQLTNDEFNLLKETGSKLKVRTMFHQRFDN